MRAVNIYQITAIFFLTIIASCGHETLSISPEQPGTVVVSPLPNSISAPWSLNGPDGYQYDGTGYEILNNNTAGEYEVTWGRVDGWSMPYPNVSGEHSLSSGDTLTITGTYQLSGSITVNPEPLSIDAPWSLTGPRDFMLHSSGYDVVHDCEPGTYTINWEYVSGWITPNPSTLDLAAGGNLFFECQYIASGVIYAWGSNEYGKCDVPTNNLDFVAIAAGNNHSLGLKYNGTVVAWGGNYHGQCDVPEPNSDFTAIFTHHDSSFGIKSDGTIVAWGDNTQSLRNIPAPNQGFIDFDCSFIHALGLKSSGAIVAWGLNNNGECSVPSPNIGFISVAAGSSGSYGHSLGLKSNGTIYAWGDNMEGQCNIPAPNNGFVVIAAGSQYSCGLKSNGDILCWGWNSYHQCDVPPHVSPYIAISSGAFHSLGLTSTGNIYAWGRNSHGECNVPSPNQGFVAVAAGGSHSLGMKSPTGQTP